MHNHGLLTVGKSARDAFVLMHHLIEAAEIQLMLQATGGGGDRNSRPRSAPRPPRNTSAMTPAAAAPIGPRICRMLDKVDRSYRN